MNNQQIGQLNVNLLNTNVSGEVTYCYAPIQKYLNRVQFKTINPSLFS